MDILQGVCDGNVEDHQKLVDDFVAKNGEHIFTAPEFDIGEIDHLKFREYCLSGRDSAGGLDN